jgi:hypothetical protein
MKALLALFFLITASRAVHNDNLRANKFDDTKRLSPYVGMLPRIHG